MPSLALRYDITDTRIEFCLDEAGYGPMFGRLYMACVVLDDTFDTTRVKDSKKFTSDKKREEAAKYIQSHAKVWHVEWIEPGVIDDMNIRNANQLGMHRCIQSVLGSLGISDTWDTVRIVVDGSVFFPFEVDGYTIPHVTVVKGDSTLAGVAAASILAKVARDAYIEEICVAHPEWDTQYGLRKNKGYGTPQHMNALRTYGRTPLHRKSYHFQA